MSFKKREDAFENKYARDEELRFKVDIRRDKLIGIWAAEMLSLKGADADAYAKAVISADFEEPGEDDVVRKIMADFQEKNIDISEHRLRKKMEELLEIAKQQVMKE
ncbi:MAG: DUF1476 domain-containing protein [Rhodovibrionaceae bacterium]